MCCTTIRVAGVAKDVYHTMINVAVKRMCTINDECKWGKRDGGTDLV